jgi:hypothetical protein
MKIEILTTNNAHLPVPRTFKGRDGKPDRTVYEQKAYVHLGGVFPVEFKLSHDDHNNAYEAGTYKLNPESFKVGQYGDLQLDRFNIKLEPVKG